MTDIRFVDTTIRDGHQSLWAERMSTGMMLPIAKNLNEAGFLAIELLSGSHIKKAAASNCAIFIFCLPSLSPEACRGRRIGSPSLIQSSLKPFRTSNMRSVSVSSTGVCAENLVCIDLVTESRNVYSNGRAAILFSDAVDLDVQVDKPA